MFFVLCYCHPNLSSAEFTIQFRIYLWTYTKGKPCYNYHNWEYDIEDIEDRVFNNFLISNNLEIH